MKDWDVIYGPPGTGKTTELLSRIRQLRKEGKVNIGFMSFTRAASQELCHRAGTGFVQASTIHSMAYRLADISREQVIGQEELKKFSGLTGIPMWGANPEETEDLAPGDFYLALHALHRVTLAQDLRATYEASNREGSLKEFLFFCKMYDQFRVNYGLVDYADMLALALDRPGPKFDALFVDEAQDLSPLQWQLIEHWGRSIPILHVAGDDDQAIYKWGGADPHGMNRFHEKYDTGVTILRHSHRVPARVHELANKVLSAIKNRVQKDYYPKPDQGEVYHRSGVQGLEVKHGEDVLFLYRNHRLRVDFERYLQDSRLPYVVDSGNPGWLQTNFSKAVRTYLKIQKRTDEKITPGELKNFAYHIPPGSKKLAAQAGDFGWTEGLPWHKVFRAGYDQMDYLFHVFGRYGHDVQPTIHLSTIHGSKGREADRVVVYNGLTQRSLENSLKDPGAEARCFYVAVTRAKRRLDIVYGQNPLRYL